MKALQGGKATNDTIDAHTRDRRRTGPGIGESLSLVLLEERHDSQRCPRGQAFVSSCRLVKGAKDSAGKHSGTSGTKMGHAYRNGAFSAAAVLLWRAHPAGQQSLPPLGEKAQPGQGVDRPGPSMRPSRV